LSNGPPSTAESDGVGADIHGAALGRQTPQSDQEIGRAGD
jgi:hypothetical protein